MVDTDLLKTILGSSAVVALVLAVIRGSQKIYENRFQARREDERGEMSWAAEYRAAAELHLTWDQEMRGARLQHEYLINELRGKLGMEPIAFPPPPIAPPLFPRRVEN
jgi:type IV secretory pathway TraG/TraD family ATPase VirD4